LPVDLAVNGGLHQQKAGLAFVVAIGNNFVRSSAHGIRLDALEIRTSRVPAQIGLTPVPR